MGAGDSDLYSSRWDWQTRLRQGKKMKTVTLLLLVLSVFSLPSTALARVGVIEIIQIVYTDLGETTGKQRSSARVPVKTKGMIGEGLVDCGDNQVCFDMGLHGTYLDFQHDLRVLIEFTSAGVVGGSRGRIIFPEIDVDFRGLQFGGKIQGHVTCLNGLTNPCTTSEVDIRLRAPLNGPKQRPLVGVMELKLKGILLSGDGASTPPNWSSLTGSGTLVLFSGDE